MSYTSDHKVFKVRAKAIMDAASPTIFIAALIGVGVPILLGWLVSGNGDGLLKVTINNVQDFDFHSLRHLFRSVWGQLTAMVGGIALGLYAIWAMLFSLAAGVVQALIGYGFMIISSALTAGSWVSRRMYWSPCVFRSVYCWLMYSKRSSSGSAPSVSLSPALSPATV